MTDERPPAGRPAGRGRRESFAERRERRAAVDDPAVVLEAAARFLEVRSRSVVEVRRRLSTAGYRADLVDGAIARMTELGMLDDAAFAQAWVESRDRSRPRGERAIRVELGQKGVDKAVIDEVLATRRAGGAGDDPHRDSDPDLVAVSADRAAAERLVAKHARSLARVADPRQRRARAYSLLARHGVDPETCREVATSAATAPGPDGAEDDAGIES
jgi:regulatory protein